MRIAIECAGFTPSEADQLRRAMATFKFTGGVSAFKAKLVAGMVARGYTPEFAERTFAQLEGFGSYGFPESHAASFALIAYASSWMKCHHPDVFCCALLNAQPMGFYAPAQLVRDARAHGVEVRAVDVNHSRWDCTLEPTREGRHAVRLGMRMVRSLKNQDAARMIAARGDVPFAGVEDLWHRSGAPVSALERLAAADAFSGSLGLSRRKALWAIRALRDEALPLFTARGGQGVPEVVEPEVALRPMTAGREVVEDHLHLGLSLRCHPVAFLREELTRDGIATCSTLLDARDGARLSVAGLVLVRQKPGSANGVMFITIEDETANANLVIWPLLFEKQRRLILSAGMIAVRGRVQREGEVIHVVAEHLMDLSDRLRSIGDRGDVFLSRLDDHGAEQRASPDTQDAKHLGRKPRDIYVRDLRLGSGIKVPTRDFR